MSSSSICSSFEANAWRSDLCSHCFQSKEEHGGSHHVTSSSTNERRYQSVLTHRQPSFLSSRSSSRPQLLSARQAAVAGILKKSSGTTSDRTKTVKFPEDDSQVVTIIGYGGQEVFEDEFEEVNERNDDEDEDDDDLPFTDEERQMHNQTQKNTSFNSVSRNLLAAQVATFVTHGVSTPAASSSTTTKASAPLVTIRPFGQVADGVDAPPRVNPVSPMRNGQVLRNSTTKTAIVQQPDEVAKKKAMTAEKITSFSDPVPEPVNVATKSAVMDSSTKLASGGVGGTNRPIITLSRKPPVWKEKPRIPIKPQTLMTTAQPEPSSGPSVKTPPPTMTDPVPGQMSVRFVHLINPEENVPTSPTPTGSDSSSLPPLISAAGPEVEEEASPVMPQEINNNPVKPQQSSEAVETETATTTRGLTRSAFEALRANLAGSLELTRVGQPARASKRQAPPAPTAAKEEKPEEEVTSIPADETPPSSLEETGRKSSLPERAQSASPLYRGSLVCPSPDADDGPDDDLQQPPRSVSLTRVDRPERSDGPSGVNLVPKPPSIRKMIRDRATQLLQRAESGARSSSAAMRLSRSDRFASEGSVAAAAGNATTEGGRSRSASKKGKSRFSIRRLLGLKKDSSGLESTDSHQQLGEPLPPPVKIRPEIVHPIDFQGQVEVVSKLTDPTTDGDSASSSQPNSLQSSASSASSSFTSSSGGRPKPPPPPRATTTVEMKPTRPPPPKSSGEVRKLSLPVGSTSNPAEYANLGDIRGGIMPKKPERSSSMRAQKDGLHYDSVSVQQQPSADEDGYIVPLRMKSTPSFSSGSSGSGSVHRHSLSSFMPPESGGVVGVSRRNSRPSLRQSRQDLHVKLEDHYGAVTGANYQALAQLLEQATSKRPLAQHFHELRRAELLRWSSFGNSSDQDVVLLRTASLTVLQSSWKDHELLLTVYPASYQLDCVDNKAPFAQPSVVNFQDQVPSPFLPVHAIKAGVEVFPPGQVATLKQLPHLLTTLPEFSSEGSTELRLQQALCVLLQVCRALEWSGAQPRKIRPELNRPVNSEEMIFYREDSQDAYRLLWLPGIIGSSGLVPKEVLSATLRILGQMLTAQLAEELSALLRDYHKDGLARIVPYLEMALFGPSGDLVAEGDQEPLEVFQRWLDVERASVLNELIRTQGLWRVKLSVLEEFRLAFLVSSSPQHLFESSHI